MGWVWNINILKQAIASSIAVNPATTIVLEAGYPSRMAPNTVFCSFVLGWIMLLVRIFR
jgi:hypothetical protein